jgi:hypothetical protein
MCRMFQWTEASVSCNSFSTMVTCEHENSASSSTCLQSMGGNKEPREPYRCNPDIPGLTVLEDPRAGATLLKMLALTPCPSKSWNKPLALSPS